jgi:hypothetical protein
VGEQRERSGFAGDMADGQLGQPWLQPESGQPRRLGHRALQLRLSHGAEENLVCSDRARERGVGSEPAVHVGPDADRYRRAGGEQRIDERQPVVGAVAEREQLFELIDHNQFGRPAVDVERGNAAGRQQGRAFDPGNLAGAHGRDHPGPEHR